MHILGKNERSLQCNLVVMYIYNNNVLSQHPSPGIMTTLGTGCRLQPFHYQGTIRRILLANVHGCLLLSVPKTLTSLGEFKSLSKPEPQRTLSVLFMQF